MAKGYWIPHIDVSDAEGYKAYMAATPEAHHKYGGRALVRGGAQEVVEGTARSRDGPLPTHGRTQAACRRASHTRRRRTYGIDRRYSGGRREHHPRWNRLCVPGAERDRDGQRGRDDRRLPAARPGDVSMQGTPIAPGPGCPTVIIGG